MRYHGRVDATQEAIVQALRDHGCSVQSLANVGHGCPDLLVGRLAHNYLLEVKSAGGRPTLAEREWHNLWNGWVAVVTTPEEALKAVGVEVA